MDRIKVYEDKNLTLEFVEDGMYLHETWMGVTDYEVFARLMGIVVKALQDHNASGVLLDARDHKGIGPESQKFAAKSIGDYAKRHGKFKEAILKVKDVFSQFSVENYSRQVAKDGPVQVKFFDSIESAEEWLRTDWPPDYQP